MLVRNRSPQGTDRVVKTLSEHELVNGDAVGCQGFESTETPPSVASGGISQKRFEQDLVIALERNVAGWKGIACEPIEHTS